MLLNNILDFIHKYTENIYNKSFILQNIDKAIFLFIIATFVFSTFMNSDVIGYFALCSTVLTMVRIIFTPEDKFKCENFELFLLAFFMLVLVSVAGSSLLHLSLKGFMKTFIYLTFYISVVHHLKYNSKNIIPILMTIALCVSAESFIGITQSFGKVDEISGWQDVSNLNPEEVMTRVYGTLLPLNPNLLGGYFVLSIPSVIGLCGYFLYEKRYLYSALFGLLSVICCIALFLTGCRGSYIGLFSILALCFVISLKFFWNSYKKLYIAFTSAVVALGTFAILTVTSLRIRVLSIFAMRSDSSNSFRFNVYKSSIQMLKDNWIVGIGQGNQNFREIYGLYMKTGFDALSAYNIYLETAVESGIFALL
ncbi:MAG: O-antigen ligase family protein, partial [Candidatus Gastranaerophilales bacterium]|nr:O-antigen ligase family protein [Candidatus Gastranaerophilales bacterium]